MTPPTASAALPISGESSRGFITGSFVALLVTQFLGALNDATMRVVLPEAIKSLLPVEKEATAIALALTTARLYPTLKYALGHGKTCSRVVVAGGETPFARPFAEAA